MKKNSLRIAACAFAKEHSYINLENYVGDSMPNDTVFTNLFTGENISANDKITLAPWDVQIYIIN